MVFDVILLVDFDHDMLPLTVAVVLKHQTGFRHILSIAKLLDFVIGDFGGDAEPGYLLNRSVSRTGARFDLRQLPLHHVRVFAKQVDRGNRATFNVEYPEMKKTRGPWLTVLAILFVVAVFSLAGTIWYRIYRREMALAEQMK